MKGNFETFVTIPIEMKPTRMLRTVMSVMTNNDKYDYTLKLDATLESMDSIKNRFLIELVKVGKMELKKNDEKKGKAGK